MRRMSDRETRPNYAKIIQFVKRFPAAGSNRTAVIPVTGLLQGYHSTGRRRIIRERIKGVEKRSEAATMRPEMTL
jgi:hypothetical protein